MAPAHASAGATPGLRGSIAAISTKGARQQGGRAHIAPSGTPVAQVILENDLTYNSRRILAFPRALSLGAQPLRVRR